jgi:hypothetical protein
MLAFPSSPVFNLMFHQLKLVSVTSLSSSNNSKNISALIQILKSIQRSLHSMLNLKTAYCFLPASYLLYLFFSKSNSGSQYAKNMLKSYCPVNQ